MQMIYWCEFFKKPELTQMDTGPNSNRSARAKPRIAQDSSDSSSFANTRDNPPVRHSPNPSSLPRSGTRADTCTARSAAPAAPLCIIQCKCFWQDECLQRTLHSNGSSWTRAVSHETKGLLLPLVLWRLAVPKKGVGQGALTKRAEAKGFPIPCELPPV